jgi:hypothetical protein
LFHGGQHVGSSWLFKLIIRTLLVILENEDHPKKIVRQCKDKFSKWKLPFLFCLCYTADYLPAIQHLLKLRQRSDNSSNESIEQLDPCYFMI